MPADASQPTDSPNTATHLQLGESNRAAGPFAKRVLGSTLRRAFRAASVFALFFAVVVLLQWRAGAFTAELSGYSDEAAHYLSGLLVRDYIAAGVPAGPMTFAQRFYGQYPYMAIGHWPPMFYAVVGVWMLLFSPSLVSVMLLMALITALIANSIYTVLRADFGEISALTTALLLILLPLVQRYSALVMLDNLLALLSFWAILHFGRFLETSHWLYAVKFGVLSSLAILTKGNAVYLALVPPIAVLVTRRFDLLRRVAFWLPALIVLLVSAPWHLLTMHLMLPTFVYKGGIQFTENALRIYGAVLWNSVGPVVLVFALIGFYVRIVRPATGHVESRWAAAAALVLSMFIFYSTVPAGIEARYLIGAMPPLFMFFVAGADTISRHLPVTFVKLETRRELLILLTTVIFITTSFKVPRKTSYGFREAVRSLVSRPDFKTSLSLVSSDNDLGEGLFISEVAMAGRNNTQVVLRASKVLADNDWNNTYYRPRYSSPQALMTCLEESRIQFLVLDMSPRPERFQHNEQLLQIVNNRAYQWKLLGTFPSDSGARGVRVYSSPESSASSRLTGGASANVLANMNIRLDHWPIVQNLNCKADPSAVR
jgi:hypothetical protein